MRQAYLSILAAALFITPTQGDTNFDTVNKNGSQRGGRPFVDFLDHRITKVNILEGQDLQPVITDDFILVPRPATCDPLRPYRVVFRATPQD